MIRFRLLTSCCASFSQCWSERATLWVLNRQFVGSVRHFGINFTKYAIKRNTAQPSVMDPLLPVILLHNQRLGYKGKIVFVKRGYARHVLLPRKHAAVATWENFDAYAKKFATFREKLENTQNTNQESSSISSFEFMNNIRLEYILPTDEMDDTALMQQLTIWDILQSLSVEHQIDLLPSEVELPFQTGTFKKTGEYRIKAKINFKAKTVVYTIPLKIVSDAKAKREKLLQQEREEIEKRRSIFVLPNLE